jgi:PIN domain nuclease of toxin-antitoxin system
MKLVLDTHALIWWLVSPDKLSARVRTAVEDTGNDILVSAVSAYEVELKRPRDAFLASVPERLLTATLDQGFGWMQVTPEDAVAAARLPLHHRDPWDRIILAQAANREAAVITADRMMTAYGAAIFW